MARYNAAVSCVIDWQLLGRPPFDYDTVDMDFWRIVSRLRSEAEWASHQTETPTK